MSFLVTTLEVVVFENAAVQDVNSGHDLSSGHDQDAWNVSPSGAEE